MNDSLWGHKDMQLSLPTTKSLNHSRRRRQHEHRRLGEAVRWRGGEAVASSSLFVPNHFISGICSVLGAYGCVRPRRRGGVQGAGKGWSASKQEWKMLPPPQRWSRSPESSALPAAPGGDLAVTSKLHSQPWVALIRQMTTQGSKDS